jgi:hypothetical protein
MACSNRFIKKCAGKVKHKNMLSAEYVRDNNPQDKNANIYECECGYYHIGTLVRDKSTKPKRERKIKGNNEHKRKYKTVRKFRY